MFFGKKKISSSEIADSLVKEGILKDLQLDKENSSESFGIKKLTDKQMEELLIFHMFVVTKAISLSFNNDQTAEHILDEFHEKIYDKLLFLPFKVENLYKFQDAQLLRYGEYYKCFQSGGSGNVLRDIGEKLSENLLGEGRKSLTIGIHASAEFIARKEFTDSIKKDFKIIDR